MHSQVLDTIVPQNLVSPATSSSQATSLTSSRVTALEGITESLAGELDPEWNIKVSTHTLRFLSLVKVIEYAYLDHHH